MVELVMELEAVEEEEAGEAPMGETTLPHHPTYKQRLVKVITRDITIQCLHQCHSIWEGHHHHNMLLM